MYTMEKHGNKLKWKFEPDIYVIYYTTWLCGGI